MSDQRLKVWKMSFISLLLLLIGILFAACSKAEAEDPNAAVIEKVLTIQFNSPDKKLMDFLQEPKYTNSVDGKEENVELDRYIMEVYGDYFTEDYLIPFIQTWGLIYPTAADFSGHELDLKDVIVKRAAADSNQYTFTATVGYLKDDEQEKTADVSGIVLFSSKEKGKIGKFEYGEDHDLYKELSSVE
ncbi:hypothetical protein CSV71_10525 [Sporosarcina sp. P21c]|uniref:hypothetical protein n=1 Tax=Sporosarcina sp. P21c TaxID=2048255 RepID=UPI000C16A6F3|nr:hypothetical protein [Sporosarcina sp. P21c]PIC89347.1 hypothetical protein CSV71_10525 [Sporosarcina sp. P21c]